MHHQGRREVKASFQRKKLWGEEEEEMSDQLQPESFIKRSISCVMTLVIIMMF